MFTYASEQNDVDSIDEMVELFVSAAGHQLLDSDLQVQSDTDIEIADKTFDPVQASTTYSMKSENLSSSSLPVLIGLLSQAKTIGESIQSVEISSSQAGDPEGLGRLADSWCDLKLPPKLPFPVDFDSPGEGRPGLIVEWDFAEPLPTEVAEYMRHVVYLWSQVTVFKGYHFDYCSQEIMFPSESQSTHVSSSSFRSQWREYSGPPHSLHSLFRWSTFLHNQGCPIEKMSLY